eukprot:TRINITY_DN3541_c0_g1_i1.p2 TRINITY_DN3541_c0_g1~~TRINITY_DN3541_c0_g1_i1.p2  ORF type:complete len:101 (+),score=13.73 TRINITY_DN3541_c0_g1_i1:101-403(+)
MGNTPAIHPTKRTPLTCLEWGEQDNTLFVGPGTNKLDKGEGAACPGCWACVNVRGLLYRSTLVTDLLLSHATTAPTGDLPGSSSCGTMFVQQMVQKSQVS